METTDDMQDCSTTQAARLLRLCPAFRTTPLLHLPQLATELGVLQIMAKNEGQRMLGSFKSLGGTYAGLRVLARTAEIDVAALLDRKIVGLPTLICASDGNHGLAVAAAAKLARGSALIFLHSGVPSARAKQIEAQGAKIVWVKGAYDDAVDEAAHAARTGAGILIADTTDDPADLVVRDVMDGYGVMAMEIRDQVKLHANKPPTHLFVQAGVGGLAASMADRLADWMTLPRGIVLVEPETACCMSPALAAGKPVRIDRPPHSAADMLCCGKASAPALNILRRHGAKVVTVSEDALAEAPNRLRATGGPLTTPSGAAGLAGVITALADPAMVAALQIGPDSRLLIFITEGLIENIL